MSHERNEDLELTRREALLAAGAGGLSMMGFCSACEAGEVKMTSGAATTPKNISKLSPNNEVIQEIQKAAVLFKNGSFSGVKVSTENVISRVQELFHKGEAAKKLGRDRSVVRVSSAAVDESDKARALSLLASEGFSSSDLQGAQIFFTRSSLLDHSQVSGLKDMPADRALKIPPLNNTNLNTLTALSFDTKANILRFNIVLNAGRGALQIAFHNFTAPKKPNDFPLRFIEPPVLKDPSLIGRIRVSTKVLKLLPPSSGSSGSSGSKSGDSSGSGSNDSTSTDCLTSCLLGFDNSALEAVGIFCSACYFVLIAGAVSDAVSLGLATPEGTALIAIACGACGVAAVASLLVCFVGCTF